MAVSRPELSVVVPTYRRPALLRRCLASLARQDVAAQRFEVVVVDDGSGDATPEVVAAAGGNVVAVTLDANAGPAAARNRGVAHATAPLVLFLDDDIVAAPDLVATHLTVHERADDPLLAVLGRVDWDPSVRVTTFMRWLDRSGLQFAYATWLRPGPVDPPYAAFYTANVSLRRDVIVDAGGFDERFPYAAYEDIELAFRLHARGLHLVYDPRAEAFTTRPIDLATFRARMRRVAESAALMRVVAPEFPLDDSDVRGWAVRRRWLLLQRLAALTGRATARERYYRSAVGTAYVDGLRRA